MIQGLLTSDAKDTDFEHLSMRPFFFCLMG